VGGVLATKRDDLAERLRFHQNAAGAVPSPFDCWLVLRGLRTLALRVERASASAAPLAAWLGGRPGVESVRYPGLAGHPQPPLMRLSVGIESVDDLVADLEAAFAASAS